MILVHGSGAENREYMLPWARFLIHHGMAILAYDKRGVGGSTGDWNTASFDDLAGDVVAAFEYLKTRSEIDRAQIRLLGISQAGWIMPLAAVRAKDIAFLISISGAGVPGAETTIDQARNEMTMTGMRQHRELIRNYFHAQKLLSSGVVEGLNNKAKVAMRKSYGFRAFRVAANSLLRLEGILSHWAYLEK